MEKVIAEMKKVIAELKSKIDEYPQDEWDRGWNAALRISIREAEKIVELITVIGKENHE